LHAIFNRTRRHQVPPKKSLAQKEKVGANPQDEPPRFEQAVNYTERPPAKQVDRQTPQPAGIASNP
jgi:hypothetical protein